MVAWLKLSSLLELYLKYTDSIQTTCWHFTIRFNIYYYYYYLKHFSKKNNLCQCLCNCVMYFVNIQFLLKFTEGFTVAWSPSIPQKCILKPFCKMMCLIVQYVY